MIDRLLPPEVAVVETTAELIETELFPEEARVIARAVEKRRNEFVTGRACARRALERLGIAPTAIPSGPHAEPLWPAGVVGSITHCRGYRACAVASAAEVATIGIDAEVNEPLPDGVWEQVAFGCERQLAGRRDGVWLDRLLFSAKEAVYKAWFPVAGSRLEFEDVEVTVDARRGTFVGRLLVAGPFAALPGRWSVEDGVVATAVLLRSQRNVAKGW